MFYIPGQHCCLTAGQVLAFTSLLSPSSVTPVSFHLRPSCCSWPEVLFPWLSMTPSAFCFSQPTFPGMLSLFQTSFIHSIVLSGIGVWHLQLAALYTWMVHRGGGEVSNPGVQCSHKSINSPIKVAREYPDNGHMILIAD